VNADPSSSKKIPCPPPTEKSTILLSNVLSKVGEFGKDFRGGHIC
jgi:hypothetical protein